MQDSNGAGAAGPRDTTGEYRARRDALRAACPDGLVLIRGADEQDPAYLSGARFAQNSAFSYLTGVDAPGGFLVLLPEGLTASAGLRDLDPAVREILFLPPRNPSGEVWTGPKLTPGPDAEAATDIEKIVDTHALWQALPGWLMRNRVLYTMVPWGETARLTPMFALMRRIEEIAPVVQYRSCGMALASMRTRKSPNELAAIRAAVEITVEGQRAARAEIAHGAGRWEYEVEAQIAAAFRSRGARNGFPPIVGAGRNGTVLHYDANSCRMEQGQLVVVDIGARLHGYTGDVTRTYPVGGQFNPRQREIYGLVLQAYNHVVNSFRPGRDTAAALKARCLALLKESPLRAKNSQGAEQTMDSFLPHGISHHLGLDVHDVGDVETPFEPGNVITIEPGLYIPSEEIGVRIEDDYLVTSTGLELIGPHLEREL